MAERLPILRGNGVTLRAPVESDKHDRFEFGRDPEVRRCFGGDWRTNPPLTTEEVDQWYMQISEDLYTWVIDLQGKFIGTCRLHNIDQQNRCAQYAIGILSARYLGRGYGTKATHLVLDYSFGALGLHKIKLRVLEFNQRAIRSYEKCGFVREGLERHSVFIAGEWQNDVLMSILEDDYRLVKNKEDKP